MNSIFFHAVLVFTLAFSALAADTPALRQTISLPSGINTRFAAISPDSRRIAAACSDSKIRVWDLTSASLQVTLDLNGEHPNVLHFSPDSMLIAAGSTDGTLRVWASSGALRYDLKFATEIDALAFSPDSTRIAVAPNGLPIEVRDLGANKVLASLPAAFSGSASIAFSRDGRWFASADTDTEIRIFDARDFTLPHSRDRPAAGAIGADILARRQPHHDGRRRRSRLAHRDHHWQDRENFSKAGRCPACTSLFA